VSDVFLSYSRQDQEFVRRLWQALHDRDRQAWVDWEGIAPSAEWMAEIRSAIDAADTFVVVVTPSSMTSNVCRQEIDHAAAAGKRIVPIVRAEPVGQVVPEAVAARNWIFFRDGDDFDHAFELLLKAIDTDLEWVHEHTRLLVRAQEWDAAGRERSGLVRGRELDAAERWLAAAATHAEPQPTQLQTGYILLSRQAAAHSQRTRLAAVSGALVVTLALAVLALVSRSQAIRQRHIAEAQTRTATSRELAATAESQLGTDPELSLLLAIQAAKAVPTVQATQALRDALEASHLRVRMPYPTGVSAHLAYSRDGSRLLAWGTDDSVRVFDVRTARQLDTYQLTGLTDAGIDGDGGLVVAAGTGGTLEVWNVGTTAPVLEKKGLDPVTAVAIDAAGTQVAIGNTSGVTSLWNVADGAAGLQLTAAADGAVKAISFGASSSVVATGGENGTVRTWDLQARRAVLALTGPPRLTSVGFASGGTEVTAASEEVAMVWDGATGTLSGTFRPDIRLSNIPFSVSVSPDGTQAATSTIAKVAQVWDVKTGDLVASFRGDTSAVFDAVFSPDGHRVATQSGDGSIKIWEIASDPVVTRFSAEPDGVLSMSWAGPRLAASGTGGPAGVWDPASGDVIRLLPGSADPVAISADGRRVAASTATGIGVWDVATGGSIAALSIGNVKGLALSPNGDRVVASVASSTGTVTAEVLQVTTGKKLFDLPGPNAGGADAAWSADGRRIVTAWNAGVAQIWDAASGHLLRTLRGHSAGVRSVAISPDGATVATGSGDQTARLWDAATGQTILVVRGVTDQVFGVALSADGTILMTGAGDGVTALWDARTGERITSVRPDPLPAFGVALSPNGRGFAVGTGEGHVTVFSCRVCGTAPELLAAAERSVTRQLTDRERQQFLPRTAGS
jgi:WD40 repeat protein